MAMDCRSLLQSALIGPMLFLSGATDIRVADAADLTRTLAARHWRRAITACCN